MKRTVLLFFICLFTCANVISQSPEHYQLKIYSFTTDVQMVNTDNYLKNTFIPSLKESGIDYVGVFKPKETKTNCTYVLIPFNSLSEFTILNNTYVKEINKLHQNVDYLNPSNTKTPYQNLESVLIKADIELPSSRNTELKSRKENRVYELTSYEATADDLLKRKEDLFSIDKKTQLAEESTFDEIFYGEVLSNYNATNLMYMSSYNPKEVVKPLSLVGADTSKRDWRKMKRKQKRNLRRKLKKGHQVREASNHLKTLPEVEEKKSNSITNLLFATEYSDF